MKGINQRVWQVAIALIVAVLLNGVMGLLDNGWLSVLSSVATTVVVMVGMGYWLDRQNTNLTKRINAAAAPEVEVRVKGITIGTLSDATLAAMQRDARHDERNAFAQLCNTGRVALTVLKHVMLVVPMLAFWGALAWTVFSPNSYAEMVLEFQQTGGATIAQTLRASLQLGVSLVLLTLFIMPAFGVRFGFKNCYSAAVNQRLRHHFNTPVEGEFRITRARPFAQRQDNPPC